MTVSYPKAQGYGARINGEWWRLAESPEVPLRYYTQDSLAERTDDRGSVYENVLDLGYVFARTNYSGGEGLDWDPRELTVLQSEAALDQIRYWDSLNLDVRRPAAGVPYTLSLSEESAEFLDTGVQIGDITNSKDFLFVATANTVKWYDGWDSVVAIGSFVDPETDIFQIEASPDDTVVYVNDLGDLYARDPGAASFTQIHNSTGGGDSFFAVWFAKGRFIGYKGDGGLYEIDPASGPASTPFDTVGTTVWSVIGSGPAVVAACEDGTLRTYVVPQGSATGELEPAGRTDVPKGEVPYLLGSNANILGFLTISDEEGLLTKTVRFYQAEVFDERFNFVVGNLGLKREWFGTSENVSRRDNIASSRDELWWTIREAADETYLWRFDIVTGGLSRHVYLQSGDVKSLVLFQSRWGYGFNTAIYYQGPDFAETGYLISPNITFGLNTDINWIATVLEVDTLPGGSAVELWTSTNTDAITDPDHPSWVLQRRIQAISQSGIEESLINVTSRTLAYKLVVYRDPSSASSSPLVTRIGIRGLPSHRDFIIEVPLNISDQVEVPFRRPQAVPGLGDTLHAKALELDGSQVEVLVLDPPLGFRGVVDRILEPTEYVSRRGSVGRYMVAMCRGSRITAGTVPTGNSGLGIGQLGIGTLGLAQT